MGPAQPSSLSRVTTVRWHDALVTPWWQPILGWGGVVIAAIITGGIAIRNARKTPHEKLKTLVEILDQSHLVWREDRHVLETAIHREIQRIARLNEAQLEGWWAYQIERFRQSGVEPLSAVMGAAVACVLIVVINLIEALIQ